MNLAPGEVLVRLGIVAVAAALCAHVQADDPGTAARALGASGNQRATSAAAVDPTGQPGYQGSNVPQQQYYNSGTGIQAQAQAAEPNSTAGPVVTTNAVSGPRYYFDSNDRILTTGAGADTAGTSELANNYAGCQTMTIGKSGGTATTATCNAGKMEETPVCNRTLSTYCPPNASSQAGIQEGAVDADLTWSYTYPTLSLGNYADSTSSNYWTGNCTIYDRTASFTIDNLALIQQFTLATVGFDDYLYIDINGHPVYDGPKGGNMLGINNGQVQYSTSGATGACELSTSWTASPNIDVRPYLVTGTNTIHIRVEVTGTGHGYMTFTATNYPDCSANDSWSQTCPSDVNLNSTTTNGEVSGQCVLQTSVCTDGPSTKTVNGIPQYRACWAYQDTYLCKNPQQQEDAECTTLRNQGCVQTSSTCTTKDSSGNCTNYQQTFQCQSNPGSNTVSICGSDMYCQNGSCTSDVQASASASSNVTQMAQASTWLQAAQDAAKDNTNSSGTFSFFTGKSENCSQAAAGINNCCTDSGWGNSIGLASCSASEKTLGIARQAKQTHYVGDYSSGTFVLKTTYHVYCVFSSMLSRIIQEQGRVQLGIDWGTPQSANCRALTAQEMASLNFNTMDFSEFYATAEAEANNGLSSAETESSIQNRTQQDLNYLQNNPGATSGQPATTQP